MREAVKQKVHCSGSIRFLRERLRSGRAGWPVPGAGDTEPKVAGGQGAGPGTTHLSFTCQRKTVWGPQPGCSLRKFPSLRRPAREESVRHGPARGPGPPPAAHPPGLEDEREVLLAEEHARRLPADLLHVHVHHHRVGPLLVRVVLDEGQAHHGLRLCVETAAQRPPRPPCRRSTPRGPPRAPPAPAPPLPSTRDAASAATAISSLERSPFSGALLRARAGETGSLLGDAAFSPARSAGFSSEPRRQGWGSSGGTRSCSSASACAWHLWARSALGRPGSAPSSPLQSTPFPISQLPPSAPLTWVAASARKGGASPWGPGPSLHPSPSGPLRRCTALLALGPAWAPGPAPAPTSPRPWARFWFRASCFARRGSGAGSGAMGADSCPFSWHRSPGTDSRRPRGFFCQRSSSQALPTPDAPAPPRPARDSPGEKAR